MGSYTLHGLQSICLKCGLSGDGTKADLVDRLVAAKVKPSAMESGIDETDNMKGDDRGEDKYAGVRGGVGRGFIPFREIEGSFELFSGDESQNVEEWLTVFEETAVSSWWNDVEKFIYLKRSLTGVARKFLFCSSGLKSYDSLRAALLSEFVVKCCDLTC